MPKTKRLFVSDFHMGTDESYSLYQKKKHEGRLLGFLETEVLGKSDSIKDLILNGDIFDTWTAPADETPPTYKDIIKSNKVVIEKLNEITANGINIFILTGNHDFNLPAFEITEAIPKIIPLFQKQGYYMSTIMRAEHGHLFTFFNKPDIRFDPGHRRPIGYFLTRLATKIGDYMDFRSIYSYIDDLLEVGIGSETLITALLEALAERADVSKIKMPDGEPDIEIEKLKDRYNDINLSPIDLINMIYPEFELGGVADRLCEKFGYQVVLFGHTHRAKIDKDTFLVEDRIYANSGAWCIEHAHFVEVDKQSNSMAVKLHVVDNAGKIEDTVSEVLSR